MSLIEHVEIAAVIRRMCGRSQSFLVRGGDAAYYVVKFANNPKGNRTLINEVVAHYLLTILGIRVPKIALMHLGERADGREELHFLPERRPICNGLHLGSKCPVDPDRTAIFGFLPRRLKIANLADIGAVYAFDHWVAHPERQFIFARETRADRSEPSAGEAGPFTAWPIDNGLCFSADWFSTIAMPLLAPAFSEIYRFDNIEHWVIRGARLIQSLQKSELWNASLNVPSEWFSEGDEQRLWAMLEKLHDRQSLVVASVLGWVEECKPS